MLKEYGVAEEVLNMVHHEKPSENALGDNEILVKLLAVRSRRPPTPYGAALLIPSFILAFIINSSLGTIPRRGFRVV